MRLLLLLGILFSTNAWATLTATAVDGASGWSLTGNPVIYASTVGANSCGAVVCNNCIASAAAGCANVANTPQAPLCACSRSRINDSTTLTLTLHETDATQTGNAVATLSNTTVGSNGTATNLTLTNQANGGTSLSVLWGTICSNAGLGSCENVATGTTLTMTVFIDKINDNALTSGEDSFTITLHFLKPTADFNVFGAPTAEGVGAFTPFPGDDKIFITNIQAATDFPTLNYGSQVIGAQLFISTGSMDNANANAAIVPDQINVADNGASFETSAINQQIANGTLYFVRMAMVDQAANVVLYYPPTIDATSCTTLPAGSCSCYGAGANSTCPFSVTPDQVLGLLSKDVNCFIATAAYGSGLEPKLNTFRDFRFRVLLRHDWGKLFVFKYYVYGPYAARFIADKPILRAIIRGLLWPIYGLTWSWLNYGFAATLALVILLVGTLATIPHIAWRRLHSRA